MLLVQKSPQVGPLLRSQLSGFDEKRQQRRHRVSAKTIRHAAQLAADQVIASDQRLKNPVRPLLSPADELLGDQPAQQLLNRRELRFAPLGIQQVPQVANRRLPALPKLFEHFELSRRHRR